MQGQHTTGLQVKRLQQSYESNNTDVVASILLAQTQRIINTLDSKTMEYQKDLHPFTLYKQYKSVNTHQAIQQMMTKWLKLCPNNLRLEP